MPFSCAMIATTPHHLPQRPDRRDPVVLKPAPSPLDGSVPWRPRWRTPAAAVPRYVSAEARSLMS